MAPAGLLPALLLATATVCLAQNLGNVLDLRNVLDQEQNVLSALDGYLGYEKTRIDDLTLFLKNLTTFLEEEDVQPLGLINGWRHMYKRTSEFRDVKHFFFGRLPSEQAMRQHVESITSGYPTDVDLGRLSDAIFRAQDLYDLKTDVMAEGTFTEADVNFIADDCYNLGLKALQKSDFYHAIPWLEHALHRAKEMDDHSTDLYQVYHALNYAYKSMAVPENYHRAIVLCEEWQVWPGSEAEAEIKNYKHLLKQTVQLREKLCGDNDTCKAFVANGLRSEEPVLIKPAETYARNEYEKYARLCRGESMHNNHQLTCQYRRHHPIFYIAPLKEETLHEDPPVRIYHDVLTSEERNMLLDLGLPNLKQSTIEDSDDLLRIRLSKTAWVSDEESAVVGRATFKSTTLANLTTDATEPFQLVVYGVAGHYDPHTDSGLTSEHDVYGDRTATVIYYLNDVEMGGDTVFPVLGIRVKPEKNSCVLWYNMLRNGTMDARSLHAGCPVLSGHKWIANKWIHENGQMFVRPCTLNPNE